MKLCATIQSERGKTIQKTGNEYIDVSITDENGEQVGYIHLSLAKDSIGDITYATIDFAPNVYVNSKLWLDSEIANKHLTEIEMHTL